MKRVLLTGGATNEYIDEVMKITNMATGESSLVMAGLFSRISDIEVTLIGNRALRKHEAAGKWLVMRLINGKDGQND